MTIRVSVIMPMHNAGRTVETAIRSLVSQTEARWEVIVVNDGSTDSSESIVRAMSKKEPRIRLVSQACQGPGAARNRGLDLAGGEYVAFLDADDWLEPDAFACLLRGARATGAACARCRMCDERDLPLQWPEPPSVNGEVGLIELLNDELFAIHAQILRRDLVGDVRFPTNLKCVEDMAFFLRLAERGVRWKREGVIVGWYRLRPRQRGSADFAQKFDDLRRLVEEFCGRAGDRSGVPSASSVIRKRAMRYATMMLLQDSSPSKDEAAGVLRSASVRGPFAAEELARTAHAYVPLSEERGMDSWRDNVGRYGAALHDWWERCEREGWLTPDDRPKLVPLLSRLIANDLDVPSMLAEDLDPERPVVLLGLGTNGLRLSSVLSQREISFSVRDDRLTERDIAVRLPGLEVPLISADQPYDPRAQHVMTLLDDAGFMLKLPRGLPVRRWAMCVDQIAATTSAQLLASRRAAAAAA